VIQIWVIAIVDAAEAEAVGVTRIPHLPPRGPEAEPAHLVIGIANDLEDILVHLGEIVDAIRSEIRKRNEPGIVREITAVIIAQNTVGAIHLMEDDGVRPTLLHRLHETIILRRDQTDTERIRSHYVTRFRAVTGTNRGTRESMKLTVLVIKKFQWSGRPKYPALHLASM
jgi:hypothetical protein